MINARTPVPADAEFQQAFTQLALPTLPVGRAWRTKPFLNTESQFYAPGTRVVFYVEKSWGLFGIKLRMRDTTYPTYVVDKRKDGAYFIETAKLALSQHEEYVRNNNMRAL